MAHNGPTSPADSPDYQRTDDDTAPVPVASTISFNDLRALKEATSPKTPPQTRYRRLARVAAGASSTSHPIICGGTTQRPGLM